MKLINISKHFEIPGSHEIVPVFRDFSLTIEPRTINAVVGPSGSGKTTLLKIVAGALAPDSGMLEKDAAEEGPVSFLFQEPRLLPWRNVFQNVELVLHSVEPDAQKRKEITLTLLNLAGLGDALSLLPGELSGGMKQRVAIARAFAYPANILLMDEPFQALDAKLKHELQQAFITLWEQHPRTVLLVTHDVREAVMLSDTVYRIAGRPAQLADSLAISVPKNERTPDNREVLAIEASIYQGLIE